MKSFLTLVTSFFVLLLANSRAADKAPAENRFFEMRTYHAAPGRLDDVSARFRDHTVKLFEKHGMTNIGYWIPSPNPDYVLIYLMAYPSREARDKSWKECLVADPGWRGRIKSTPEADGKIVARAPGLDVPDRRQLLAPGPAHAGRRTAHF